MLEIGNTIQDFELPGSGGKSIKLSDFRGKKVVLYFYPRDNTPGCTTEGLDFKLAHAQFQGLNTEILGVSRESVKSHDSFSCKHEFPFALISDPDEVLCNQFAVIKEKNMYGRKLMGIERSTFLIDPDGALIREWRNVKVKGHVDEVLAQVEAL